MSLMIKIFLLFLLFSIGLPFFFLFFAWRFRCLRAASDFPSDGKVTKTPPGTRPMDYGSASLRLGP